MPRKCESKELLKEEVIQHGPIPASEEFEEPRTQESFTLPQIGRALVSSSPYSPDTLRLDDVYIFPDMRDLGHGSLLLDTIIERSRDRFTSLEAPADNERIVSFFQGRFGPNHLVFFHTDPKTGERNLIPNMTIEHLATYTEFLRDELRPDHEPPRRLEIEPEDIIYISAQIQPEEAA